MSESKPECTVPTLLRAAADWLEVDPKRWTRQAWGRNAQGMSVMRTKSACSACGQGAMEIVTGLESFAQGSYWRYPMLQAADEAFQSYMGKSIPGYNDNAKSGAQVANAFRTVAARYERDHPNG